MNIVYVFPVKRNKFLFLFIAMTRLVIYLCLLLSIAFGQDVLLTVPANPLTAAGLATPFINNLNQSVAVNSAFVQGAIFDPTTNNLFAYNPLVITVGTNPAVVPTAPNLNNGVVVGLWFGSNGNTLTLVDNAGGANLAAGVCVNGVLNSIFGQFAYCNAANFFLSANNAINAGTLKVPPLGTANDGLPCPTPRDFFIVDMDQSDNVVTTYILTTAQLLAQNTITNTNLLGAQVLSIDSNGSDERLVSVAVDGAFGCVPWKIQDLADVNNVNFVPTLPTNEMMAAALQAPPIGLVPISHAMTRVNNQPNLPKVNAYRTGVDQVPAGSVAQADGFVYCQNLYFVAPKRLAANQGPFSNFPSADPNAATNLFAFLCQRFFTSFSADGLNCASLLNVPPPVVPIKNMNNIFTGATITVPNPNPVQGPLSTTTIIIICVCSIVGGLLVIGLIIGVIWYRNRSMYS